MCRSFGVRRIDAAQLVLSRIRIGQIDIDSDEAAISGAIAFASRKRPRMALSSKTNRGGLKSGGDASSGVSADPNLVGVKLTAQGKPERVFMGDETQ